VNTITCPRCHGKGEIPAKPPVALERCRWCGKRRRAWSDWEQEHITGGYSRLCAYCANQRLRHPWNALIPMRKIPCGEVTDVAPQPGVESEP
jgi:RecJ-like exonuclease